jgi:hypothetical protein
MRTFLIRWGLVTMLLAVMGYLVLPNSFFDGFRDFTVQSWGFLALLSLVVFFIFDRAMRMQGHSYFMSAFGVGFSVKFFGALAFIGYYIISHPNHGKNFVFPFFGMYFLYTGILIWSFWKPKG